MANMSTAGPVYKATGLEAQASRRASTEGKAPKISELKHQ